MKSKTEVVLIAILVIVIVVSLFLMSIESRHRWNEQCIQAGVELNLTTTMNDDDQCMVEVSPNRWIPLFKYYQMYGSPNP